ncbi:MAG TPA: NfeD family protein [Methylocella sp.]|nr:NfeD family protein [Methylocella sp.]
MDVLLSNPAELFLVAGLALLGIDVFLIGLSPLMIVAIGALATSGILYLSRWKSGALHVLGWQPDLLEGLAIWGVISLLIALMGWRSLQRFQNSNVQEDQSSDLIGRELVTTHDLSKTEGYVYWSGTLWQARLADSVNAEKIGPGVRMRVVQVKNLALILTPLA